MMRNLMLWAVLLAGGCAGAPAPADGGTPCDMGLTNCYGLCTDTTGNPRHCGKCDIVCDVNQVCASGACAACDMFVCNGSCVNLGTDSTNCGTCDIACKTGKKCVNGTCH